MADGAGPSQVPSHDPTASQLAQANECHERLLARDDETERFIIELRQQGYTTADIAEQTGWNVRRFNVFSKICSSRWIRQETENEVAARLGPHRKRAEPRGPRRAIARG